MAEDRGTPAPSADPQRELDARVEDLAKRLADVVNSADIEHRQDLREYALGLLRDETERDDGPSQTSAATQAPRFSPLAFAFLVFLVSLPLLVLFLPLGLGLLGMAVVMGTWGIIDTLFRR